MGDTLKAFPHFLNRKDILMHRGLLSPTGDFTSYLPMVIVAAIGIAILAFAFYKRKK